MAEQKLPIPSSDAIQKQIIRNRMAAERAATTSDIRSANVTALTPNAVPFDMTTANQQAASVVAPPPIEEPSQDIAAKQDFEAVQGARNAGLSGEEINKQFEGVGLQPKEEFDFGNTLKSIGEAIGSGLEFASKNKANLLRISAGEATKAGNKDFAGAAIKVAETIDKKDAEEKKLSDELKAEITKESKKDKVATGKLTSDLRKEFNGLKTVKETRVIDNALSRMEGVWADYLKNPEKGRIALDQALVVSFNKLLDPGSVVRESEFARTPQGLSLIERWNAAFEKAQKGGVGLNDTARKELMDTARQLQQGQRKQFQAEKDFFTERATEAGIKPEAIIRNFTQEAKKAPGKKVGIHIIESVE